MFALFPRLKERRRQTAGTLSGGEQQMLAMGRALMSKPKLLLLDEPSMGLAPLMVQKVFETVLKVSAEGVTILLIEQNAKLALEVSNRGYVMESGRDHDLGRRARRCCTIPPSAPRISARGRRRSTRDDGSAAAARLAPPAAHLHPRIVPWQHALAWYEDAMRLFKRGPATWVALAVITIAAEFALRLVPSLGPLLAEIVSPLVACGLIFAAASADRGGPPALAHATKAFRAPRGRDRRDHRVRARHVRGRSVRRMVDRRHEPARPGRRAGRHSSLRS